MSTLDVTVAPLGNGFYSSTGSSTANTYGAVHPVITDIWNSGNYILAPLIDWTPTPEYDNGPAPAFVPAIPIPGGTCVVGCSPVPTTESPVPEPAFGWGVAILIVCLIISKRRVLCPTKN